MGEFAERNQSYYISNHSWHQETLDHLLICVWNCHLMKYINSAANKMVSHEHGHRITLLHKFSVMESTMTVTWVCFVKQLAAGKWSCINQSL